MPLCILLLVLIHAKVMLCSIAFFQSYLQQANVACRLLQAQQITIISNMIKTLCQWSARGIQHCCVQMPGHCVTPALSLAQRAAQEQAIICLNKILCSSTGIAAQEAPAQMLHMSLAVLMPAHHPPLLTVSQVIMPKKQDIDQNGLSKLLSGHAACQVGLLCKCSYNLCPRRYQQPDICKQGV